MGNLSHDVLITIDSSQKQNDDATEISFQTKGRLYNKNGTYYLKYEEELEGLEGVESTLKLEENRVTLIRQGEVRTLQKFISGRRTEFEYNTLYGTLQLEVEVDRLSVELDSEQGRVDLVYKLYKSETLISINQLSISYKEE